MKDKIPDISERRFMAIKELVEIIASKNEEISLIKRRLASKDKQILRLKKTRLRGKVG